MMDKILSFLKTVLDKRFLQICVGIVIGGVIYVFMPAGNLFYTKLADFCLPFLCIAGVAFYEILFIKIPKYVDCKYKRVYKMFTAYENKCDSFIDSLSCGDAHVLYKILRSKFCKVKISPTYDGDSDNFDILRVTCVDVCSDAIALKRLYPWKYEGKVVDGYYVMEASIANDYRKMIKHNKRKILRVLEEICDDI